MSHVKLHSEENVDDEDERKGLAENSEPPCCTGGIARSNLINRKVWTNQVSGSKRKPCEFPQVD